MTPAANLPPVSLIPVAICHWRRSPAATVDTGSKFTTGVNNTRGTGGKFATGVVDTGGAP